jgi:hypothetical protein
MCHLLLDIRHLHARSNAASQNSIPTNIFHGPTQHARHDLLEEFSDPPSNDSVVTTHSNQEDPELETIHSGPPASDGDVNIGEFPWADGDIGDLEYIAAERCGVPT